jgi:hypothetical protein
MSNIKKLVTPEGVFETEMTPEEINAREQKLIEEQQLAEQARIDNEAKKAQKEADALAGNNKLLELGLTQAQVTAMTGYTPPVSE